MEKTREFIRIHLQPIIDLENEGTESSIIMKEDYMHSLEHILQEYETDKSIHVLEIGFGAGFAAVYFLFSNPNLQITCIDEGYHRYSYACFEKIREYFGEDRIRFYLGDSNIILPILQKEKYDIIHYDGSGSREVVEKDFQFTGLLYNKQAIGIFSNPGLRELWENFAKRYHLEKIEGIDSTFFRQRKQSLSIFEEIPRKIHRIWLQTDICEKMQKYSDRLQNENPEFEYILYNLDSAREFIQTYFDTDVLHAFDSLVPFAFKSDLLRYCILYIQGGIYLDMKYEAVNGFRFTEVLEKEQYVLDIDGNSVYNAFLICKPRSNVMMKCIFQIVKHVREKDYTRDDLSVTGPGMMKHLITNELRKESKMRHICIHYNKYILRNGIPILKNYHRYYEDTPKSGQKSYLEYWRNREIYSLDIP